jgi:hypothetical protein
VNQVALLLLGLLGQNVAVVSVISLNLTRTGERESLLGAGLCLYFWHCFKFLIFKLYNIKAVATHIPGAAHLDLSFLFFLRTL